MVINYCEKCHQKKNVGSFEILNTNLKKINSNIIIDKKCQSTCGLSQKKFVATIYDEEVIVEESLIDLLKNIKENHGN